MLNTIRVKRNESILHFIYLMRDDMFSTKDRTKFFDIIIPIVPVVDNSNAYDMLNRLLSGCKYLESLDISFLRTVSLYIDEMRILTNICFEFIIYCKELSDKKLDRNHLFAIIIYKNLFPKDFDKLHKRQGYIYELIKSKKELIKHEILHVKSEQLLLEEKLGKYRKRVSK